MNRTIQIILHPLALAIGYALCYPRRAGILIIVTATIWEIWNWWG